MHLLRTAIHEEYNESSITGCGRLLRKSFNKDATNNTGELSNSGNLAILAPILSICNKNAFI